MLGDVDFGAAAYSCCCVAPDGSDVDEEGGSDDAACGSGGGNGGCCCCEGGGGCGTSDGVSITPPMGVSVAAAALATAIGVAGLLGERETCC